MAIEFEHGGKKYRADTPSEAAALRYELERQDAQHGTFAVKRSVWTADLAMDLLSGIGDLQKKFLSVLAFAMRPIESGAIVELAGLDSEVALAGVVSGLSKQLRKMSINPADLYRVNTQWKGKDKIRLFELVPDFAGALTELGWPEAWEKAKQKGKDAATTKDSQK